MFSIVGISVLVEDRSETGPILLLMGLLISLTFLYLPLGYRARNSIRSVGLLVVVVDTLLMSLGQYLLGGANAYFGIPLYGILIVMAASLHSGAAAYSVALLGSASYALMAFATSKGWIPQRPGLITSSIEDSWVVGTIVVIFFLGIAMALVVSTLTAAKDAALTRSRVAESMLRDLNADLESRVERAVAHQRVTNDTLRLRNDDLVEALRQINLFASAVSHDLRNPITAAGEALRLSRSQEAEGQMELIDLASANLDRVDQMVVGLRDVMLTVGGKPRHQTIAVRGVLEEVIGEIRDRLPTPTAAFELVGAFRDVDGNPGLFRTVFRNLISNAVDHNQAMDSLKIRISQDVEPDGFTFHVHDNGRGLTAAERKRAFEPFYRGGGPNREGLGLGLALVSAIVSRAGGRVSIDPEVEHGAKLSFSWPNLRSEDPAAGPQSRHESG